MRLALKRMEAVHGTRRVSLNTANSLVGTSQSPVTCMCSGGVQVDYMLLIASHTCFWEGSVLSKGCSKSYSRVTEKMTSQGKVTS